MKHHAKRSRSEETLSRRQVAAGSALRNTVIGLGGGALLLTGLLLWLAPKPATTSQEPKPAIGEMGDGDGGVQPLERAGLGDNEVAQTVAGPADPMEVSRNTPAAYAVETRRELYEAACASCHMPDGQGARGAGAGYPALAGNPKMQRYEYVASFVLNGAGGMPSFRNHLTDEQVADVINFVRQDLNNYTDPVNPASIRPLRRPSQMPDIDGAAG